MTIYALVRRPDFSHWPQSVNLVYDVIASHADENGFCRLSLKQLCAITQRCRKTVKRAIRRLVAGHFLHAEIHHGRGLTTRFYIRAFTVARKALEKGITALGRVFHRKRATSPTPSPEQKTKNLKTRPRSCGSVMGEVRHVVQGSPFLSEGGEAAILKTLGRMLFYEGFNAGLCSKPTAIADLMARLATVETPSGRRGQIRKLYGWARWWLVEQLADLGATPTASGLSLLAELILNPCLSSPTPTARDGKSSRLVGTRGASPSGRWVSRRRKTWSEKGITPCWAKGGT